LDYANSVTINATTVPGIKSRDADTGVELGAGETLAIAGLVEIRSESENHGIPWLSELPYVGAAFRKVKETKNEIELLILVTPELVEGMSAEETPRCGPGMQTTSPSDWELFMKGHLEVPNCCPPGKATPGAPGAEPMPPEGMIEKVGDKAPTPAAQSRQNVAKRNNRQASYKTNAPATTSPKETQNDHPGFIGPVGYDVVK
jgi:pilus assembly protein CpaC